MGATGLTTAPVDERRVVEDDLPDGTVTRANGGTCLGHL